MSQEDGERPTVTPDRCDCYQDAVETGCLGTMQKQARGNGKREDMQLISRVRSILGVVGREITRYALWNWVRALVQ